MSLTKPEMWIAIITLVLIFGTTISIVGSKLDLAEGVTLDTRSEEYISEYAGVLDDNDISADYGNTTLQEKEKNPMIAFATSLPLVEDVLGGINFIVDKSKVVFSYLALIYNLPSFFLQGFGLQVSNFSGIINILGTMFLVVLTIMAVRLVKWA